MLLYKAFEAKSCKVFTRVVSPNVDEGGLNFVNNTSTVLIVVRNYAWEGVAPSRRPDLVLAGPDVFDFFRGIFVSRKGLIRWHMFGRGQSRATGSVRRQLCLATEELISHCDGEKLVVIFSPAPTVERSSPFPSSQVVTTFPPATALTSIASSLPATSHGLSSTEMYPTSYYH